MVCFPNAIGDFGFIMQAAFIVMGLTASAVAAALWPNAFIFPSCCAQAAS
jgi:hypothetical protein